MLFGMRRFLDWFDRSPTGVVSLLFLVHFVLAFIGMKFAQEVTLVETPVSFVYWYFMTVSTIGYGDLSPTSDVGRLIAALFVAPVGLLVFGAILGKMSSIINRRQEMKDKGAKAYKLEGHVLIIADDYNTAEELFIVLNANKETVVVMTNSDDRRFARFPNWVKYHKSASEKFNDVSAHKASRAVVMLSDDSVSVKVALHLDAISVQSSVVIDDHNLGELLEKQLAGVTCVTHNSLGVLLRVAECPLIDEAMEILADSSRGVTLMSECIHEDMTPEDFENNYGSIVVYEYDTGPAKVLRHRNSSNVIPAGCTVVYVGYK